MTNCAENRKVYSEVFNRTFKVQAELDAWLVNTMVEGLKGVTNKDNKVNIAEVIKEVSKAFQAGDHAEEAEGIRKIEACLDHKGEQDLSQLLLRAQEAEAVNARRLAQDETFFKNLAQNLRSGVNDHLDRTCSYVGCPDKSDEESQSDNEVTHRSSK
ncbi:unnamed protein product [Durusdinium trenchii]|uniref:Uncharacterized protein n=1 Tax=Durusdinium trenchii TaxID=1381693 RepID=A0ABP0QNG9_9DINO